MSAINDKILVLNTGSSSVKFSLYSVKSDALIVKGTVDRLGTAQAMLDLIEFHKDEQLMEKLPTRIKDVEHAIPSLLDLLHRKGYLHSLKDIAAVGHRVVHGAEQYTASTVVTPDVVKDIRSLERFAPLHNPYNLQGILRCQALLDAPNVAVFDTAFHHTLEKKVYLYGISPTLCERHGIRKYGFHGTNHKYCSLRAKELLGAMPEKLVTCHIGNGSSITAIKDGNSVETSMGFTPTDGLIMGTRSGAIDPEVVLFLQKELHLSAKEVDDFLNRESGLKAIAGSSDMRDLWRDAQRGDERAKLAISMLSYRIALFIGSYAAALDGLDCLVFTAGIGENAWYVREEVCERLRHLGVLLDDDANRANEETISAKNSDVKVFVIPANEELQIGRETRQTLGL